MQPISKEILEKLISEAKAEGKDTTELEAKLSESIEVSRLLEAAPTELKMVKKDKRVIISTGPVKEEDFEP